MAATLTNRAVTTVVRIGEALAVQCDECRLPTAYIEGPLLVLQGQHYGKRHSTRVDIRDLKRYVVE